MSLRARIGWLLVFTSVLLFAQDPPWKTKPIDKWDSEDANQVLTSSPWAQRVTPQWVRDLSPDERRMGGDMEADRGKGVGLDGLIGIFDPAREAEAVARAHAKPDPGTVLVRWESARPVRAAEQKSPDPAVAALDTDQYYVIAVYNMPTPENWNEGELRGVAALKRAQSKDLKPSRVVMNRKEDGLADVFYLFRRSVEIRKRDGNIIFQAQVGRLVVTRIFSTFEMQIHDQLEL
jgi:hypothetical protein